MKTKSRRVREAENPHIARELIQYPSVEEIPVTKIAEKYHASPQRIIALIGGLRNRQGSWDRLAETYHLNTHDKPAWVGAGSTTSSTISTQLQPPPTAPAATNIPPTVGGVQPDARTLARSHARSQAAIAPAAGTALVSPSRNEEETEFKVAWFGDEPSKYVPKPGGRGAWFIPLEGDELENEQHQRRSEQLWEKMSAQRQKENAEAQRDAERIEREAQQLREEKKKWDMEYQEGLNRLMASYVQAQFWTNLTEQQKKRQDIEDLKAAMKAATSTLQVPGEDPVISTIKAVSSLLPRVTYPDLTPQLQEIKKQEQEDLVVLKEIAKFMGEKKRKEREERERKRRECAERYYIPTDPDETYKWLMGRT